MKKKPVLIQNSTFKIKNSKLCLNGLFVQTLLIRFTGEAKPEQLAFQIRGILVPKGRTA
jgi:hypothetical protein